MPVDAYTGRPAARVAAILYIAAALTSLFFSVAGPVPIDGAGPADIPVVLLMLLHFAWGCILILTPPKFSRRRLQRALFVPELLLSLSVIFYLFTYFYALNANMDYVDRFIEETGVLRLALDTETERAVALLRFLPFLAVNAFCYLVPRLFRARLLALAWPGPRAKVASWSLVCTGLSVVLQVLAFPNSRVLDGVPVLGWIALVPLFMVLQTHRSGRGAFYGVVFGTLVTLLSNFWLSTFNLVSLQFAVVLFFLFYTFYMVPVTLLLRRFPRWSMLILPFSWTLFEFLRSSGFLGYPWVLTAHSQYANTPLIQLASVTGVWGVSFVLLLVNAGLALTLSRCVGWHTAGAIPRRRSEYIRAVVPAATGVGVAVTLWFVGHVVLIHADYADEPQRSVRVALIQQNTDPRQAQYRRTLSILQRLTHESMRHNPDLVAWSETAFVPNIRRWASEDPPGFLTPIVLDFLDWQRSLGTWLLTGNDDYEVIRDLSGRELARNSFNAAVLFSDTGERRETYRKIKLVPFTEYFPYRDILPEIYELLQTFDINLWEPGRERTVFEHPLFRFSTPICFEDVFPNEVRQFVRAGAEVILNITNDYWSLTEVQAKQHFAGGMFRAVENRRQLLRSTASGLTAHVDPHGRILETLPYFEEAYMVRDVPIADDLPTTVYTRFGDWFILVSAVVTGWFMVAALRVRVPRLRRRDSRV